MEQIIQTAAAAPRPLQVRIKTAEARLCAFLAAHNIPFNVVDQLIECLSDIFTDSDTALGLRTHDTKANRIVVYVLGSEGREIIRQKLATTQFSVMMDESTEIPCIKTSCIVVGFFNTDRKDIVSLFWALVQVFVDPEEADEGATAEHLFNLMVSLFRNVIPLDNINRVCRAQRFSNYRLQ